MRLSLKALRGVNELRERFGDAISCTCAYRNKRHNRRVGGKEDENGNPTSQHYYGTAFDLVVSSRRMAEMIEAIALALGFTAIGRYPSRYFIHIDMRRPKPSGTPYRWGRSWAAMS